jgi:hypothetical protein
MAKSALPFMVGTLPFPGSEKSIAGFPFVAVPCCTCGDRIWTSKSRVCKDGLYRERCSECVPIPKQKRGVSDKALGADIRYNGN